MPIRLVGAAACLAALAACQQPAGDHQASAQATPTQLPDRPNGANTLLTAPITVADGLEAIVQDAVFPPEAELSAHHHPGEEVLYMIEGTVVLMQDGMDPLTLKAGDAYAIPAGLVHNAKAGPLGARAVIFRAHVKGEPVRIEAADNNGVEG